MKLRARVGILTGLSTAVAVGTVGVIAFGVYVAGQSRGVDGQLVAAASQANVLAKQLKLQAQDTGKPAALSKPVSVGNVELQLITAATMQGTETISGPLTKLDGAVSEGQAPAYFADESYGGETYRVYTAQLTTGDSAIVRATASRADLSGPRWKFGWLMAALTVLAGLLSGGLGRLLAGRALLPVRRLTAAAEQITRDRGDGAGVASPTARLDSAVRSERSPVGAAHRSDEVEQLREAFAEMLGAVDRSTVAQRQLVADASHELRTPLTSMRTNLDLLAEPPGLADPKAPELVEQARAQAKELAGLVADLVQLARDGRAELLVEETRLDLLVEAVVERRIRYRPEVRVDLDLRPCVVLIDVDAAQRAVANLLDNAVKWSPPGAAISVEVGDGAVTVTDCGPGIPETDLPHVFERFYRSAEARSRPGSGLGLAIVAQVAAIHGGSVEVTSSPAGSRFCLSFSVHSSVQEPLPQDTPTRTALGGARAARAGDGPD